VVRSNAGFTVCASLSLLAGLQGCSSDTTHQQQEKKLIGQIDSLKAIIRSSESLQEDWDQRAIPVMLYKHDEDNLRKRGLSNPLVDLAKDLRSHPELLPGNPVPDGMSKYGFYDPHGIHALTGKWVLAEFDDGHGGGYVILQYAVNDSGSISWKPLLWAWDGADEPTYFIK
jgi:hypothetical protein